jgi:hypothetical protein
LGFFLHLESFNFDKLCILWVNTRILREDLPMNAQLPLLLTGLLLLAACGPSENPRDLADPNDPADTTDTGDTTVPDDPTDLVRDLIIQVSPEQPTVAMVSWSTSEPTIGWVEFGLPGELLSLTGSDTELDTEHGFMLVGMLPSTEYELEILNEHADGSVSSLAASLTTGFFASAEVEPVISGTGADTQAGGFTLAPVWGDQSQIVIFDAAGRQVWSTTPVNGGNITRARMSIDGHSVLYNSAAFRPDEPGSIVRVSLDGSERAEAHATGAYMDFVELEPGRYAALSTELIELDGDRQVLNETIVEFGPGLETKVLFEAVGALDIDLDQAFRAELFGPEFEMPCHLNSLQYDRVEDVFYTTSLYRRSVIRIDRATGGVDWELGNEYGDFEPVPGAEHLNFAPHSAMPTEDGVMIFDRGSPMTEDCSAAVSFDMDMQAMSAYRDFQYWTDDCQQTMMLGNAQPLWNGNTMLVLAMNGQIDEVTPEGELVWRLNVGFGDNVMFSERFRSFYE